MLQHGKFGMGLFCAIIVCSAAACGDLPMPAGDPQLVPREIRQDFTRYNKLLYSVHITYPYLQYPKSDDPEQENVNYVDASVFNQSVAPDGLVQKFTSEKILSKKAKAPSYLTGSYSAQILKNGVVSALVSYGIFRPNTAPEYHWSTVNYCPPLQKIYQIFEFFRPEIRDPQSRLSALAVSSLKQQGYADPLAKWRDSERPGIVVNLRYYMLTDTDLLLIFPTNGAPAQVSIPLDTLAPLLRPHLCEVH